MLQKYFVYYMFKSSLSVLGDFSGSFLQILSLFVIGQVSMYGFLLNWLEVFGVDVHIDKQSFINQVKEQHTNDLTSVYFHLWFYAHNSNG